MITLLNAAGHAPPIYASFSNGLCYGFVQGCCPNAETIRSEPIWRYFHLQNIFILAVKCSKSE